MLANKMKMCVKQIQAFRLLVLGLVLVVPSFAMASGPVGHVLLVAGEAARVDGEGNRQPLADKSPVFEGDTLETGAGSRLQVKMVDNALLVIQPKSRLVIRQYNYDAQNPSASAARLDLVKGRARSVTGDLGEANHDAFRLNTPIAAIGIRGTDFETSTTDELTRVRLNSGAIVISPLGEGCPAVALGPCDSANSLLLNEELESPVAELRATDTAPRIIDLPEYESSDQGGINDQKEEEHINAEEQAERIVAGAKPTPPALPEGWVDEVHWGRWESVSGVEGTTVSELVNADKEILFNNGVFVLFRDGFTTLGKGQASFYLQSYQAGVLNGNAYTPVTISNGSLAINFDERKFNTGLTMGSGVVNGLQLNASGTIDSSGLLKSNQGNMSVLGGLTEDVQAGYLFTHTINESMSLQGATQWQQP